LQGNIFILSPFYPLFPRAAICMPQCHNHNWLIAFVMNLLKHCSLNVKQLLMVVLRPNG
jgi:hypothetical protein